MVKFYDDLREKGQLNQRRKPNLEQILTETPSTIAHDRYPYILSINGSGFACLQVRCADKPAIGPDKRRYDDKVGRQSRARAGASKKHTRR